ncbi:putative FmdB family regulatory protein [Microbacterium sp. AG1240]|uniref:FmdB family zinc ribbon protein n=1 Tax=Microbacterium sp. AG1240 TaxID=2183992 RepID=UPI000EABC13C|nr:FmdB family zinc ribbon protein [Microbacterium sp. AG1240]RKT33520.1 putative FmdB family regulatory protein [Microbacterium sp. AG1240]
MPTYAYACKSCGHRFDTVQSFSEASLTECPECGGELRKQYGSIGVTFNGSGFYRTDSRSGEGKKADASSTASSGSAPAAASSTSSSSGKTESKASAAPSGS